MGVVEKSKLLLLWFRGWSYVIHFTLSISKPELLLFDPRQQAHEDEDRGHDDRPQLNVQHVCVEGRLRGERDGHQAQGQDGVAADSMVFVDGFRIVDAAEQIGGVVLGDADNGLKIE